MVNTISFLLWATLIIIRNRMVAQEGKGRRKRQLPGRRCVSLEAAVGYLLLRNTWRLCSFLTFSLTPVFPAASVLFLLLGAKNIIKGKERAQRRKGNIASTDPSRIFWFLKREGSVEWKRKSCVTAGKTWLIILILTVLSSARQRFISFLFFGSRRLYLYFLLLKPAPDHIITRDLWRVQT